MTNTRGGAIRNVSAHRSVGEYREQASWQVMGRLRDESRQSMINVKSAGAPGAGIASRRCPCCSLSLWAAPL